jgi:hypothetical protein
MTFIYTAQRLAGGENRLLCRLGQEIAAPEIIEQERAGEADIGRGLGGAVRPPDERIVCARAHTAEIARDIRAPVDDRAQRRNGLRHILVGGAQQGAVLIQKTAVEIGIPERIGQRLGAKHRCRGQQNQPCQRKRAHPPRHPDQSRHHRASFTPAAHSVNAARFSKPGKTGAPALNPCRHVI